MTMAWKEDVSGHYTKDFGNLERIYRRVSQSFQKHGREHWGLYCVCGLELTTPAGEDDDLTTALRDAWGALRSEFPGLGVVPGDSFVKTFQCCGDSESLDRWKDATFFVKTDRSPSEIIAEYALRDLPALYVFPRSSEILLLSSHWRMDGLGMCMLLDCLFSFLVEPPALPPFPWTNEVSKISPSLEDAAGSPTTSGPEIDAYARQLIEDHHRDALHAGGLPYVGDLGTTPGHPSYTGLDLSEKATAEIVGACKARGISVTSVVHAALAAVIFELSPDREADRYTALVSANLRPYLLKPYNGKQHAIQTYVAGVTPQVRRCDSFEDHTKQLTSFYHGIYSPEFLQSLRMMGKYHSEALFAPPRKGQQPPKPPSSVTLSSLGVIERHLRGEYQSCSTGKVLKLTNFEFGVSMMTRQMLLYVWTFKGQLQLSVNYNDAYHDEASAKDLIERIKNNLRKGLQVDLE